MFSAACAARQRAGLEGGAPSRARGPAPRGLPRLVRAGGARLRLVCRVPPWAGAPGSPDALPEPSELLQTRLPEGANSETSISSPPLPPAPSHYFSHLCMWTSTPGCWEGRSTALELPLSAAQLCARGRARPRGR